MKKGLLLAAAVLAVAGVALVGALHRAPPPGFVSLEALPVYRDPALLARGHADALARGLEDPPHFQTNPTVCGPTSLANVTVDGTQGLPVDAFAAHAGCLRGWCLSGLTLDELARAAHDTVPGWVVSVVRPADVDALRAELRKPGQVLIANFDRFPLFGRGGGHHSPIGGYLEPEDLVYVLDVNAEYRPWLAPVDRLFEAMNTIDPSSGKPRGLLVIHR